jgi:hypothetical protein
VDCLGLVRVEWVEAPHQLKAIYTTQFNNDNQKKKGAKIGELAASRKARREVYVYVSWSDILQAFTLGEQGIVWRCVPR